jgi:hypothetical protein
LIVLVKELDQQEVVLQALTAAHESVITSPSLHIDSCTLRSCGCNNT